MLYQSKDGILCEQTWQTYEQEKDACWLLVLQQEEFRDHLRELCLPSLSRRRSVADYLSAGKEETL